MALNEIYANGESLNYAVDAEVKSGDFVVLYDSLRGEPSLVGVAEVDAKLGADELSYATLRHIGVFTGTSEDAIEVGQKVYLASGFFGSELFANPGSYAVGIAIKAKDAGAGEVYVRINN
jgi:predicted RecA/RadA family phage recombinase